MCFDPGCRFACPELCACWAFSPFGIKSETLVFDSSLFVFFIFYLILHSLFFYILFDSSLFTLPFLYPSCLKDFLFGIVDFLELAFGSPFDIVAKGGYTVGMMLESKLAVGSLDLLVGG